MNKKIWLAIAALTAMTLFAMTVAAFFEVSAQDRLPEREFVNPDELVMLSEGVPFGEALDVIEELSVEFRGKVIIDRSGFAGEIGTPVPRLHWRDALDRIASYNDLVIREEERYYEITAAPEPEPDAQERVRQRVEEGTINFDSREIEIEATFFEGSRQVIRELGIDWSTLYDGRVRVDNVAAANVTEDVLSVEVDWGQIANTGWELSALFSAFETSNKGEVLSSPTIKVVEGEQGRIQVGQDFSIRQRDFAGNVIDQFFSTGTILEVTPQVLYHEGTPYIYMTVDAERSTASPGAVSTIVNKQEARTEVLLLSGESTIIAGLYETEETQTRRGIPYLKDLPGWFFGLRYLFGYNATEYSVQELVVVLQAKLVPTLQERLMETTLSMPELIEQQREHFQQLE